MEASEKEVHSKSNICPEGKQVLEALEEETAPNFQFEVCSWFEKFIPEGKCGLEEKKKEAVPSQVRPWFTKFAFEKGSSLEKKKEVTEFEEVAL